MLFKIFFCPRIPSFQLEMFKSVSFSPLYHKGNFNSLWRFTKSTIRFVKAKSRMISINYRLVKKKIKNIVIVAYTHPGIGIQCVPNAVSSGIIWNVGTAWWSWRFDSQDWFHCPCRVRTLKCHKLQWLPQIELTSQKS